MVRIGTGEIYRPFLSILLVFLFAAFAAAPTVYAADPDEILNDPALEERARDISRELRCVVCQSQSIDDSDAPLAKDMRKLVRERLVEGDSDEEVFAFMVARYGDYVLLKPPVQKNTLLLWTAPLLFFAAASAGAVFFIARMPVMNDATSEDIEDI